MRWIRFLTAIIILITVSVLSAQYGQAGDFLRFGANARSLAMGGSYTVLAKNADALLYNPAGLANTERWELSLTHAQLFLDSRYDFLSFAYPLGLRSGIGLAIADIGVSKFDGRDEFGTATGEFDMHNMGIMAGYGRWLMGRKFRVGVSAKFLMTSMGENSASGFGGVDVGIITKEVLRNFRFGLAVQNIGALDVAGEKLPMTIRGSVGFRALRSLYLLADVDIVGSTFKPKIGAEFELNRYITLRAGYNMTEITAGVGFAVERMIRSLEKMGHPLLDYSAGLMNPLGNDFGRVSLTLRGKDRTPPPPPPKVSICDHLSEYEGALHKDGLLGAKANVLFGYCNFIYESVEAPLLADPSLKSSYEYFREAYEGKFGGNWTQAIMTLEGAGEVFHQKIHYMYAESKMNREAITEETKQLIQDLIFVGGDSTQYDPRLQYDLGYTYEMLGYLDSAKQIYGDLANRDELEDNPVYSLSLYRLAYLIRESNQDSAIDLLDKVVRTLSWGFYNENGERISYPMFPKYKDNMLADDALLLMGDIYAAKGGPENTQKALISYLDILLFYPNAVNSVLRSAMERSANAYEVLGMTEEASLMRERAGSL